MKLEVLKRMRNGNTVSSDDIQVEVWKFLRERAVEFFYETLQHDLGQ